MKRENAIRLAKEAGFAIQDYNADGVLEVTIAGDFVITEQMEKFAALVSAAERERCAKVCEAWGGARKPKFGGLALRNCATAIRDLGDE